ncbi:pyridoxamine 5'-phosphate oxidase family protein [Sphingomonas sp. URHD0057]|uniref:pyridoxamine 5'-phosphate oxidase family protein n=1 Tax=Sphingomonas sp. URHD0057 TaxID=1380389 RepID=UPI00048A8AE5|nr:pyridoxamine 5'-phosphate oxidase family protein [Sphingomonas sp. URHD0057]
MVDQYPRTTRTTMRRRAKRATYDAETIHAIFDEALIASVAVAIDGAPHVQPMIHARIGSDLILHGLATNRLLNAIANGAEACINVMIIDAMAVCRRIEDHSMLYRSATVYGRGRTVEDEAEKQAIMTHVFESLVGKSRTAVLPPLPDGYLGGTMIVVVPIDEAVGKVNSSVSTETGPDGVWSGFVPVKVAYGEPRPDDRTVGEGLAPPSDLTPRG